MVGDTDFTPDPYSVLDVTPMATAAEITDAFRRRLRALHPETQPSPRPEQDENQDNDQELQHLLTAYIALRRLHEQSNRPGDAPA